MKLSWLIASFCGVLLPTLLHANSPAGDRGAAAARDTVVLLHGLGRTSFSMSHLAAELGREGYRVVNLSYPSRTKSLEQLATQWLPEQLAALGASTAAGSGLASARVHFVTHSMGGIVVRLWLRECGAPANLGRVVMLAPPNSGSEISDRLERFPPFRWFTGANGRRLTTEPDALPRSLGAWPEERVALGVIAGDRALNPLMAAWLPAPNDGKVTVASTHLAGERDHVVVPYSHTWLAWRRGAIAQVKAFLRDGKFAPAS